MKTKDSGVCELRKINLILLFRVHISTLVTIVRAAVNTSSVKKKKENISNRFCHVDQHSEELSLQLV
jgi:hypothetical protein